MPPEFPKLPHNVLINGPDILYLEVGVVPLPVMPVIIGFHSAAVLRRPLWVRGNYFCKRHQRRRNIDRGKALPPARANLLVIVMGGMRRLLANLLTSY